MYLSKNDLDSLALYLAQDIAIFESSSPEDFKAVIQRWFLIKKKGMLFAKSNTDQLS